MIEAGLILEGGGMRGLYTAGVLDFFLEKNLEFSACYGVSAGACHLTSYMSKQKGRAFNISTKYLKEREYCSAYTFLRTGDLFGVKMCYDKIPNVLDPYDYDEAMNYPGKCFAVATNLETGRAEYLKLHDLHHDITAVQASASLPLLSRNVEYEGRIYLDGGIADSIPVKRSIKTGNSKNVVILTRPAGYRKKPISKASEMMMRKVYRKYPRIVRAMKCRHIKYNSTLDFIEQEEKAGRLFVLRPEPIIKIERIEKDARKLKVLYLQGYHDAAQSYEAMMKYLES